MTSGGNGHRFFLRKPVGQIQAERTSGELKPTLSATNLVLLGIGNIIGAGIFVQTGRAAAEYAGPAVMLSFLITGFLCAFVGLCYAELASALPVSGSTYSYTYASMGEGPAWVMGLLLILEYGLAAATVAVGWSGYFSNLLADMHLAIPAPLTAAMGTPIKDASGAVIATGLVNLPAMAVIGVIILVLLHGVSTSATVNNVIVMIKLTVVVLFILIGSRYIHPALWHPFIPAEIPAPTGGAETDLWHEIRRALVATVTADNPTKYGLAGVIHAAAIVFSAYLGFEAISTAGAEAKNPARDMPIGIIGALASCTLLYVATSAVLTGIVPYQSLNNAAPLAVAVDQIGLPWFAIFVKVGALAGLTSVMLVAIYGQSRIFYSMAHDGLMPKSMATVSKTKRVPWVSTLVVGLSTMLAAGFLPMSAILDVTSVGALSAFILVCVTVIYLRISQPKMHRPFRVPFYPVVPLVGVGMCLLVLMSLMASPATRRFFFLYLAVGMIFYFVYGARHAVLGRDGREKV